MSFACEMERNHRKRPAGSWPVILKPGMSSRPPQRLSCVVS